MAHPRQIGGLGFHSKDWFNKHQEWEAQSRELSDKELDNVSGGLPFNTTLYRKGVDEVHTDK